MGSDEGGGGGCQDVDGIAVDRDPSWDEDKSAGSDCGAVTRCGDVPATLNAQGVVPARGDEVCGNWTELLAEGGCL